MGIVTIEPFYKPVGLSVIQFVSMFTTNTNSKIKMSVKIKTKKSRRTIAVNKRDKFGASLNVKKKPELAFAASMKS